MGQPTAIDAPLIWLDMEMTGLDPDTDEVLEIAVVVTDRHLNTLATGPDLILNQPASRFAKMDAWNQENHVKTGLWKAVLESTLTLKDAESQVLEFVKKHTAAKASPLCGNSVWQDRRFLFRHMPRLEAYLHYRIIDVSTIKEITSRWYPDQDNKFAKKNSHRALDDVLESIEELKFFREKFFIAPKTPGAEKQG